jgi:tRNA(adenine34) deaminase
MKENLLAAVDGEQACKTWAMSVPALGASSPDAVDVAFMDQALAEARAALIHHDVPVGAVVVHDGVVIAARHNERELHDDPVGHAEVLAMRDAAAHLAQWRLGECTMYVTLEPCAMCAGAMVNARLGRLVFGATDPKAGAAISVFRLLDGDRLNHRVEMTAGVEANESSELLKTFFQARR